MWCRNHYELRGFGLLRNPVGIADHGRMLTEMWTSKFQMSLHEEGPMAANPFRRELIHQGNRQLVPRETSQYSENSYDM